MNKTVSSALALALVMVLGSGVVLANDATIVQSGDRMTATIDQTSDNTGEMIATIKQRDGINNTATITQSGDERGSDGNAGTVKQIGSRNVANLTQRNFATSRHTSDIKQEGNGNSAEVLSQGGVGSNSVDLLQKGDGNDATIEQMWGSNEAVVTQRGDGNEANVGHRGAFDSDAFIKQVGNSNEAIIAGIGQSAVSKEMNIADVDQIGDRNFARIDQLSSNNDAVVRQNGNANIANITQSAIATPNSN